jgi:hypothetical protein
MITVRLLFLYTMFVLVGCRYEEDELNHLLTLDGKVIRTIQYPHPDMSCGLTLNNLISLTPQEAYSVASWNPNDPPLAISHEWGNWLYQHPEIIRKTLFDFGVGIPKACGFSLELNGISELSEASAKALSTFKGDEIQLNGLTELSSKVAEALVPKGRTMSFQLDGLQTLSVESAKALGGVSSGDLSLASVYSLDPESYIALGNYREVFRIGVREMTVEEAAIVASWNLTTYIHFPHLEKVSYDHAQAFVHNFRGGYTFDVIDVMDVPTATVLYNWVLETADLLRHDRMLQNSVSIHLSEDSPLRQSKMCYGRHTPVGLYCE